MRIALLTDRRYEHARPDSSYVANILEDDRVLSAAAAAGYTAGCSLSVHTAGPLAWPRIGVYGVDSPARFRLKVSRAALRARRALARRKTAG